MSINPPRNGEGDRGAERRGGGGVPSLRRPETYQARRLRKEMSLPEILLWERLRGGVTGVKFRRQHPIGPYVADFYCAALKLVIEVDGHAHDTGNCPLRDDDRDAYMKENGHFVIRIPAADVLKDLDQVAEGIAAMIANPLHRPAAGPPPRTGEDFRTIPPRHGEGDHSPEANGGGGVPSAQTNEPRVGDCA